MFELMLTYCLVGKPCESETVANFPQYDVGMHMCGIAKTAIEMDVRARVPSGTRVTFKCQESVGSAPAEYEYQTPSRERSPDILEQVLPRVMQEAGRYLR